MAYDHGMKNLTSWMIGRLDGLDSKRGMDSESAASLETVNAVLD